MGFDFHQDADRLAMEVVDLGLGIREEKPRFGSLDDCRVVLVGRQHVCRAGLGAAADHLEQRLGLLLSVDDEVGIEDLVPAVFAVGLREHHQFDVGWVSPEALEAIHQVVDFVGRQGEAHGGVRGLDGLAAAG